MGLEKSMECLGGLRQGRDKKGSAESHSGGGKKRVGQEEGLEWARVSGKRALAHLAVVSSGCCVPTSFRTCIAMLLSSSLSRQRRLMKDVG